MATKFPWTYNGEKWWVHGIFSFDWIFMRLADNQNKHKIPVKFKIQPDQTHLLLILETFSCRIITGKVSCLLQGSHKLRKTWKKAEKKFHAWKNHGIWKLMKNHGILAWDGFLDVNITQIFLARSTSKKEQFVILEQSASKTSLFIIKQEFSY